MHNGHPACRQKHWHQFTHTQAQTLRNNSKTIILAFSPKYRSKFANTTESDTRATQINNASTTTTIRKPNPPPPSGSHLKPHNFTSNRPVPQKSAAQGHAPHKPPSPHLQKLASSSLMAPKNRPNSSRGQVPEGGERRRPPQGLNLAGERRRRERRTAVGNPNPSGDGDDEEVLANGEGRGENRR